MLLCTHMFPWLPVAYAPEASVTELGLPCQTFHGVTVAVMHSGMTAGQVPASKPLTRHGIRAWYDMGPKTRHILFLPHDQKIPTCWIHVEHAYLRPNAVRTRPPHLAPYGCPQKERFAVYVGVRGDDPTTMRDYRAVREPSKRRNAAAFLLGMRK